MKTNIQNMFSESRSYSDVSLDRRFTVSSPSGLESSTLLKMVAVLVMAFMLGVGQMWGDTWNKVTSAPSDWSGEYLLVYESSSTEGVAWTGVDANYCNTDVTISSGVISTKPNDAVSLIIASITDGYSIQISGGTNDGKYIGGTSGSNTISFNNSAILNTLSYESSSVKITSNTSVLRFNSASNNLRFRYFKSSSYSSQQIVQLYKKTASGYTVTIAKNNDSYGTVTQNSVTGVTSGTSISASGIVLSVGATNVTATPNSGYKFTGWTGIPGGGTVTGNVTVTANFAAVSYRNYRTSCATDDPSISVTSSLTDLGYIYGNSPVAQTFSISGSNLTAGTLTITAPEHFQVSLDGSDWSASDGTGTKTITIANATLSSTTIYVRLASGKDADEYSGNVSISGCGLASAVNVAVVGTVVAPTITATPASVTWSVDEGGSASDQEVLITGANLKGAISAELTTGNATDFSISSASISKVTAEGAGGTITISYTGSTATAGTKTTKLRLTATDASTVDVTITLNIQADSREKFTLLTTSNVGQLSDGAKIVIVNYARSCAMNQTQDGTKGHGDVSTGYEFLSSNTIIALAATNEVEVLTLEEQGTGVYALKTLGNKYLKYVSGNTFSETASLTSPVAAGEKWSITIDGTNGNAKIQSTNYIGYNADGGSSKFRSYSSPDSYKIYAYFQPSTAPSITVSPTSLTGLGYVVGDGANSEIKSFTVTGMNLSGNLTVKAPTNYQVSTDNGSNWSAAGGTASITASGTLNETTVKVRLVSGKPKGTYNDATGVKVYGGGVLEANAKTVSLAGAVTNPFHTVTISAGSHGSVSPSGSQSVEEGGTLTVTPTADTGYEFSSWTVTGSSSSCVGSTFTMGTENATLTANFSEILVTSISITGTTTVKPTHTTQLTATCTPSTALNKNITWSTSNSGIATVSNTGLVTGVAAGSCTITATNTNSGVSESVTITVQETILYKYYELTSSNTSGWTGSDWDGEYLIVNTSNACYFNANTSANNAAGTVYTSCTITNNKVTLEDDNQHAVRITYVANSGYTITPVGTGGATQYLYANGTGNTSWAWYASAKYFRAVDYNNLDYSSSYCKFRWNSGFKFYGSTTGVTATNTLYKREIDYTITCNTPTNGTLASSAGTAAAGTTITLTVTPNSHYELDALTITKAGGGTVTPTYVDATHYTFTMPADNVTVTATFKAAVSHTLHFNVPTCVTAPSDITGEETGATVTLPSEPAGTPDGYTFQGWVLAAQLSPVAVKPTTYTGSYTVPSGDATLQYYALYSEGGISVGSGTFNYTHEASSGLTTLVNLTSDDYYIFSSTGNNAAVVSNTISGTRVGYTSCTGAGESTATISTAEGVYLLHKTGSYYTLKNMQTGQYLASNGNASQATMMDDDGTDDHVKWSIVSTSKGYKLANKYNTDNSVNAYLGFSTGNGYGCYAASNTTITMFFYKAASGAVTVNATYTTNPDCYCDYTLLKSTDSGSNWEEVGCFTKVKPNDASDHEWQLANFTMPAHNSSTLLKVQRQGYDYGGQTGAWQSGWIPLAELQGGSCTYKAFELQGAVGTLRIYDVEGGNSVEANSNFYLGFYPTYQICHKNAGPDVWINETFELVDAGTHKYQTAITTAPASYFDDNYQFYVGARKADGSTKFVDKNSNEATSKSNTTTMKTMGGMTSDVGGRSGVYEIYSNSCDQNWYCQFVPYYVVYYYDVNGNEIEEWRDVMTSTSTTAHPYATGQTSWNTAADGSGTTYAAGATISGLSDDLRLYQIASTYTVTYSVASETSSYNGTSVKVIQGQAITLPTITFSCAQYPTFVGWVSGADILETNPLTQIEEPSTLVGAGGDSYTPTGNVTLKALYGSSISNDGWKKATSISAGTYFMYAQSSTSNYVCSGWNSSGGDKTAVDDVPTNNKFADKPSAASTITIDNNHRMSWDGYYAVGADKDLNYTTTEAEGTIWDITNDGYIHCTISSTDYYIQIPKSGTIYFKTYSSSQDKAYLYKYSVKGYYTTNPTCALPTQLTVTYMKNVGDLAGVSESDVENWCSNEMLDFSTTPGYPTLEEAFEPCATPTLDGYTLQSWNTSSTGLGGTEYKIDGTTYGSYNGSSLTLYAQWDRTYTVHFIDRGDGSSSPTDTEETQASLGASVAVPSNPTPCDTKPGVTWTFVGWGTQDGLAQSLNGHIEITAGTSTYTPSDDITLYAVYRKSTGTSDAFAVGTSGAYTIGAKQGAEYAECLATTKFGTGYYCSNDGSVPATIFYLNYVNSGEHNGQYTLQDGTTGEYVGYAGSSTSLSFSSTTPYYYNVVANGTGWNIQCSTATTRYFTHETGASASNFKAYQDNNPVTLHPAAASTYYTVASCDDDFNITFVENGSVITWQPLHGEGTYQHLADGTEVNVFPTATFDGWTFLGWRTADYDESTTAPEASTIYGGSDGTSGNHYVIHSSITMYPVFTRFEDNEPFDQINGGDYYIYFLESGSNDGYGAEKRVYAAEYSSDKRYNSSALCSAATTFTFTKLENGNWTIYDNTTHMYLYGIEDDDLKQQASATGAEWTLTVNGNQFDAFHVGTSYGQLIAQGNGTSATFMNYRRTNTAQAGYNRVYLGSCTNRVFSSNPSTIPEIDLKGTVVVTASQNGAVRATNVLTVSGHNLTPSTGEITITSNNSDVYFSLSTDKNFAKGVADQPETSVTITANGSGIVTPTPVYVHYKPSSNTDTWTSATITASYTDAEDAEVTAELRTVKENFVIASKVGDNWYALPANMAAEGVFEPVLIDVDESAKIAYGPATVGYKMWPVQTVNGGTDEYAANGDKVRFAGNSNAGLWASNSNNHIRNWATITAIGSTAETPASYEWIIETEDREAYTLKSMYSTNYLDLYRPSSGAHAGKLVWATNGTYETNEIHIFPLTEREVITIIPREWKANGLVFSVAADNQITAVSYKIGTGSETSTTYTRHSTGGYGLYEVALPDLTSQYGKLLTLKLTISGTPTYATTTIPIIVNANASTKTNEPFATLGAATKDYDVVVLDGKTLTTDASASGACKFQNLYIYPGATLVNAANNNLSVRYLELRGGIKGIDHKSDLAQGVPHLKLDKNFSSTAGANLDMYVNTAHSYALSVPFDVTLSTVNFANSLNTTTSEPINGTLDAQFMIMEYDGAQRASTGKGWKHITSTERVLHAGEGYVLQGKRPKGQPFAVIRFPFSSVTGWADGSGEVTKSAVSISEHAGGASTPDNDKGWNLIANPYMATLSYNGADEGWAADFTVGSLVKTDTDPWDGKYEWTSTTNAYVTMPNEWYTEFPQYRANSAQAVFEPFKNFFIQASADGSVTFDKSKRASAPRHLLAQVEKAQPIYADINLTHGEAFAQAGLTVDENATAGYKFGEDQNIFENRSDLTYLKVYTVADGHYLVGNTMTPAETEELIPVEFYAPNAEGEYIFSLDDNSDIDRLEYVILYDAVLGLNTNLLTNDYMVELDETGLIENRFSIGLRIKEKEDSATGVDNVNSDKERPFKFIYQDKLYILLNGVLYDATGKKVK